MLAMKRSGFAKAAICAAGASSGSIWWRSSASAISKASPGSAASAVRARRSQRLDHALAQLVVLRVGLAQQLDLGRRRRRFELSPQRRGGFLARARPHVGVAHGGTRHHLRVAARRRPPRGPTFGRNQPFDRGAQLGHGDRAREAGEDALEQLGRSELPEAGGILHLLHHEVVGGEGREQLAGGAEPDADLAAALELDPEALELHVEVADAAGAVALDPHDRSRDEAQDALEPRDAVPDLGGIARGAAQVEAVEAGLEAGVRTPHLAQRLDHRLVQPRLRDHDLARFAQQLEALAREAAAAQLVGEHLEERAGGVGVTRAGQVAADAGEPVEVLGRLGGVLEPGRLDGVEVAFLDALSDFARDCHGAPEIISFVDPLDGRRLE